VRHARSNHLLSGGTAEWHLIVNVLPVLKENKVLPYPQKLGRIALSDDTVRDRLTGTLRTSGLERLCVVFDAERRTAQEHWEELREILLGEDYADCPAEMPPGGLIVEAEGKPRVGVWIMPDNVSPGMIEDLYTDAIAEDDRERMRAEKFIDGIPEAERLFRAKRTKAVLGVWLSIQEDPMSPGQALGRNAISSNQGKIQDFAAWLQKLFAEELV